MKLATDNYFTPTHMLADSALCKKILGLAEFKEATLFDFAKTGNLPTPLGMRLVPMEGQPANKLTILDAGYAVQKLTEQDLMVESDKLISQQWDRTYLTVVTDFAGAVSAGARRGAQRLVADFGGVARGRPGAVAWGRRPRGQGD